MVFGWRGQGLEIDLGTKKIMKKEIDQKTLCLYLGGRGLGTKLLFDNLAPGVEPLSPENILVFAAGPLTGTRTPAAGRHTVISKSPLTGTIFGSNGGGFWGPALKGAGYDYILLKGRSKSPVFLFLEGEKVLLQDATKLWGKNTENTLQFFKNYCGAPKKGITGIACIGRAGEAQVPFASILNDGRGACGRGGLGAVMGSKNLKAVVVRGGKTLPVADREYFQQCCDDLGDLLTASPVLARGLSIFGTPVLVNLVNSMRLLPVRNFRQVYFPNAAQLSGEKIRDALVTRKSPCDGCPLACKARMIGCQKTEKGKNGNIKKEAGFIPGNVRVPGYQTLAALGPGCGHDSLEGIIRLNALCNDYGIDTISVGGTLACYAELLGRELQGGEMENLLKGLCEGEGVGQDLRGGAADLAAARGRPELAMHVKKLELPGYDPRGALGLALGYATSNRGGCHLQAAMVGPEIFGKPKLLHRLTLVGKAGLLPVFQNFSAAVDALTVCHFTTFSLDEGMLAAILSAVTGVSFTAKSLGQVGERIWNLERLFNLREGFHREDDTLPARFFRASDDGYAQGIKKEEFMLARQEYYRFRGWTGEGIPTARKLAELKISRDGGK